MKHLAFCNKVLMGQHVDLDEMTSFIADYCNDKGKYVTGEQINIIVYLVQMQHFDIIYAIKEYAKMNNLVYYVWKYPNGNILKHWIE